jgi:hypothetical protein
MKINVRELAESLLEKKEQVVVEEKQQISFENVDNETDTAELYNSRALYREQINDKNLPIKNVNNTGQVLNNQLDTWYEEHGYGKYDYEGRLLESVATGKDLSEFENGFLLLDFVADAAQEFFRQYNVVRASHPRSRLNNIGIVKAYEPRPSYNDYINSVYEQFFNEVLDPIKNSNKIKNVEDFINLLYVWFLEQDIPITETGFYEQAEYNIYNTGLAFDFFKINNDEDKKIILTDVRYPTLNYVAKVNGLRIDPNYPARLIADIQSEKLLNLYVKNKPNFFGSSVAYLPKLILEKYFKPTNFIQGSQVKIDFFMIVLSGIYDRFIKKYKAYPNFSSNSNIKQTFKKEFVNNKVNRGFASNESFNTIKRDNLTTLNNFSIKTYIRFRVKESGIKINLKEEQSLIKTVLQLNSINNSKSFLTETEFSERLYTETQPINFLEMFIKNKKADNTAGKKQFVFFWNRAKQKLLTGTEEFANLVETDDEGFVYSPDPTQGDLTDQEVGKLLGS